MLTFWGAFPYCALDERLVDSAGLPPSRTIEAAHSFESGTAETAALALLKLPVQKYKVSELTINSPDA